MVMLSRPLITMAWCILRLWTEEMPSRYGEGSADVLNKQSWTAIMWWCARFGVRYGANNSSHKNLACH